MRTDDSSKDQVKSTPRLTTNVRLYPNNKQWSNTLIIDQYDDSHGTPNSADAEYYLRSTSNSKSQVESRRRRSWVDTRPG